jgi:UDP:flavonoid glycosyltransferase YjiC (YdhE family)
MSDKLDTHKKNLIGFFPLFYNLSETGRGVLIAKQYQNLGGKVVFFSHGGQYEYLAKEMGFDIIRVKPFFTDEFLNNYYKRIRENVKGQLYPPDFVKEAIKNEIEAFKQTNVKMIVSVHNYLSTISARAVGIPLVSITTGPGSFHYSIPDEYENYFTRPIPQKIKVKIFNWAFPRMKGHLKSFNAEAKRYGVNPLKSAYDLFYGDITLLTSFPEFINVFPNQQHFPSEDYVGIISFDNLFKNKIPLKNQAEIEDSIKKHLDSKQRSILLTMGSSGEKNLFLKILKTLNKTPYRIIAVYTNILKENEMPELNENILLLKYVPSISDLHKQVDLSIIHGGQGTVYTAAYAGKPVIGFPMQFEQHLNLEKMVGHGTGLLLSKRFFKEQELIKAIESIFENYEFFLQNSETLAQTLSKPEGAKKAAQRIFEIVTEKFH